MRVSTSAVPAPEPHKPPSRTSSLKRSLSSNKRAIHPEPLPQGAQSPVRPSSAGPREPSPAPASPRPVTPQTEASAPTLPQPSPRTSVASSSQAASKRTTPMAAGGWQKDDTPIASVRSASSLPQADTSAGGSQDAQASGAQQQALDTEQSMVTPREVPGEFSVVELEVPTEPSRGVVTETSTMGVVARSPSPRMADRVSGASATSAARRAPEAEASIVRDADMERLSPPTSQAAGSARSSAAAAARASALDDDERALEALAPPGSVPESTVASPRSPVVQPTQRVSPAQASPRPAQTQQEAEAAKAAAKARAAAILAGTAGPRPGRGGTQTESLSDSEGSDTGGPSTSAAPYALSTVGAAKSPKKTAPQQETDDEQPEVILLPGAAPSGQRKDRRPAGKDGAAPGASAPRPRRVSPGRAQPKAVAVPPKPEILSRGRPVTAADAGEGSAVPAPAAAPQRAATAATGPRPSAAARRRSAVLPGSSNPNRRDTNVDEDDDAAIERYLAERKQQAAARQAFAAEQAEEPAASQPPPLAPAPAPAAQAPRGGFGRRALMMQQQQQQAEEGDDQIKPFNQ